jgi:hypothetical protein
MPKPTISDKIENQPKEASHEDLLKKIIANETSIVEEHKDIKKVLDKLTEIALHSATSPKTSVQYYNKDAQTITAAGPNPPAGTNYNPNDNVYSNSELVYMSLQPHRRAPRIQIINDSTDTITDKTIFVISTSDGSNWTPEATILIGEARSFFNVWELRLRSPTAGVPYRVTEWDIWLPYSRQIAAANINLNSFTAQNVAVPFPAGALLPNIPVPNGFFLVVRANVSNANRIFIAGPSPGGNAVTNVGVAATRNTLNAGDAVQLFVSNANLVAVLDSVAAGVDTVDILVEQ